MKRLFGILTLLLALVITSCTHKELCDNHSEHAHRFHIRVHADYRCDWEELGYRDWQVMWPDNYIPYESLRPTKPSGLRVINYNPDGDYNIHNLSDPNGGVVTLYEGENDILFCNNDTEYIVFTRSNEENVTLASTRSVSRATYTGNPFAEEGEGLVAAPDMLFANYRTDYISSKTFGPVDFHVELQPLVFTYKVRCEFAEGLEYVALARGVLTGMAKEVIIETGETSSTSVSIAYDCELTDFGARALVRSFGVPGFPNPNYPMTRGIKHGLTLEVMLKSGKPAYFEFDVTDQVNAQPHGGVIVVKDIVVKKEDGTQGSGAFDVEVDDWGPYQDIPLEF